MFILPPRAGRQRESKHTFVPLFGALMSQVGPLVFLQSTSGHRWSRLTCVCIPVRGFYYFGTGWKALVSSIPIEFGHLKEN